MSKLLIATSNPAKLAEYRRLLESFAFKLLSLRDLEISQPPEESGATFAENALLKGRHHFRCSGLPTLADDGGLEVDALGGAPGVRSHRWVQDGRADDQMLVNEVLRRMEHVEDGRRSARIRCAMALIYRHRGQLKERVFEAALEGVIARKAYPKIRPGFPYRAVLFLPERGCMLAELGEELEAQLSQRRAAVNQARPWLAEIAALADPAVP